MCHEPLPTFSEVTNGRQFDELDAQDAETIRYGCADSDFALRLYHIFNNWFDRFLPKHRYLVEQIESPTAVYLGMMKHNGVPVDVDLMKEHQQAAEQQMQRIRNEITMLIGDISIGANCSTKAFKDYLYQTLKLPVMKVTASNKEAADDASMILLKEWCDANRPELSPLFTLVQEYRKWSKIKSTYIDGYLNSATVRIHPDFFALSTETGRMNCRNPNLQNCPRKSNDPIGVRNFIQTPENHLILSLDFSQIELRVGAFYCRDKTMMETYQNGGDMKTVRTIKQLDFILTLWYTKKKRRCCVMGIYLNPGNDLFYSTVTYSEIYVDKTMLIAFTNKCLFGENKEICVSRPRRFGKSMAENMLTAYYSKGCDSRELFSKFQIAQTPDFEKHLNRYNVIHVDMQKFLSRTKDVHEMLDFLQQRVLKEMKRTFSVIEPEETSLITALEDLYSQCDEKFIFIIDEWDSIFRVHRDNAAAQKEYLDFLRDLLKGQPYVALAYMTGILPIKKYGEHSALNMFKEYSMTNQKRLAEFTGFTEEEVRQLCEHYHMSFEKTKQWYDGYNINGISIYNPKSVAEAMSEQIFDSYWTQTETYEALKMYIVRNENGLRDKIIRMIAGEHISINTKTFQNDMCTFETADDILTLLVHLGYLTYDFDTQTAWIPNKEVRQEFLNSIQGQEFQNVNNAIHRSDKLLQLTLAQNAEKVAEMLQEVHSDNCSVIQYNDENSLACVLSLAYYSAQDSYTIYRELQGGEGFADLVFVPRTGNQNPAMIVELKWNQSTGIALKQIKNRNYILILYNKT